MNIKFYSEQDLQQINDNLDNIEVDATKKKYELLEPNNEEYHKVKQIIINFIKEQKRIIYGGSAYHAIIQHYRKDKNNTTQIYPDWERFDIEFYSPKPIRDMVMICNRLSDANIKYVMGRQAQHDETFTIFANFLQYCDMSYMPERIYNNIKTIEIDGIRYIHPEFIMIDIFRMYNDPLTSAWRFGKVFKRMRLLMDKFDFEFTESKPIIFNKPSDDIIKNIIKIFDFIIPTLLKHDDKILFTGQIAYSVYTNPDKKIDSDQINQIEIITDDLDGITDYIITLTYNWLSRFDKQNFKNYDEFFSVKKYSRFFQYWDKRNVIYYMNKPLFTIIGSANRCLPYIDSKINFNSTNNNELSIKLASFLVTFNYFFIGYQYCQINKSNDYYSDRNIINSLISARNNYLKSKNKTVIDSSIYKDFILTCSGKTTEFTREFLLRMSDKRAKGQKGLMSYDPSISRGDNIEYQFEQADGLIINNEK
jgi:hypothetical protein